MKGMRGLFCAIILMSASGVVRGVDLGVDFGYCLSLYGTYSPPAMTNNGAVNLLRVGLFVDIDYLRLRATGLMGVGPQFTGVSVAMDAHILCLSGDLTLKLPVRIASVKLWTGAGVRFVYNALMDFNGDGIDDRTLGTGGAPYNDLYLLLEVGGSVPLAGPVSTGASFTINYDLLSNVDSGMPAGSTTTGFFFEFIVHVSLSL